MADLTTIGKQAKKAAKQLNTAGSLKDKALFSIATALRENVDEILKANQLDLDAGKAAGLTTSLLDRLALSSERIEGMAQGVLDVAALADPVGNVLSGNELSNGLRITNVTVPLGVIGIIYEARPNVTADAAALCLKAGNAVILRGGKEAINSNIAISKIMRNAIAKAGLDINSVQLIEDTSRKSATELMELSDYLDVLIPRGGAGLIKAVVQNAKVPVIETGTGNCHVFIDETADIEMASDIVYNAKTSRPSVCNAIETVLVHKNIAENVLHVVKQKLDNKNVEIRGCEKTQKILGNSVKPATEDDYYTEFLDFVLAVKVVDSVQEAIEHIAKYSSGHSEAIVTQSYTNAERFLNQVDSAAVYVNASTRYTDGSEFGLGAEIGISTQKLHARGPMGLKQLTSTKYIIRGNGQIR